jgi:AcrR family transcriptional regulator
MGRPKAASIDEATRERLLGAAAKAFGHAGFSGARLEDIAADAGIRRSSLLYHFDSKETLYTAVLEQAFGELERRMELTMSAADSFEARHERLVEGLIAFEQEHRSLLQVLMRSLLEQDARGAALLERSFVPLVDRIEHFMREAGGVPESFPVRAAILQQIMAHLVRCAMGPAGEMLWAGEAHTWVLAQAMLRGALSAHHLGARRSASESEARIQESTARGSARERGRPSGARASARRQGDARASAREQDEGE